MFLFEIAFVVDGEWRTVEIWEFWDGILINVLMIVLWQRLAAKDLDDWEQKRVKRLPGEHDGVL